MLDPATVVPIVLTPAKYTRYYYYWSEHRRETRFIRLSVCCAHGAKRLHIPAQALGAAFFTRSMLISVMSNLSAIIEHIQRSYYQDLILNILMLARSSF